MNHCSKLKNYLVILCLLFKGNAGVVQLLLRFLHEFLAASQCFFFVRQVLGMRVRHFCRCFPSRVHLFFQCVDAQRYSNGGQKILQLSKILLSKMQLSNNTLVKKYSCQTIHMSNDALVKRCTCQTIHMSNDALVKRYTCQTTQYQRTILFLLLL